MDVLTIIFYVVLGTIVGSILCLIPSLHIYNVAGIALIIWLSIRNIIPYDAIAPFFISLVVAFSFLNTLPMTFLNAVDESAGASMLPSNDMVMRGKGKDAALLTGLGTLIGAFLLLILTPFFFYIWTYVSKILTPHLHWILGIIMVFYLMSEWPKGAGRGPTVWAKFKDAWRNVFAGLLTFTLSGIFGIIYISKTISSPEYSFQNIMPAFIGFFALPSIIQSLISEFKIPKQYNSKYINADWMDFGYGSFVGFVGGILAAWLPGVTAGISSLFAGHITNHRNLQHVEFAKPIKPGLVVNLKTPEMFYRQERVFVISWGIGKIIHYVGAFLFLFVLTKLTPYGMGRGGLNILLKPIFTPEPGDYFIIISTIILSAGLSFLILLKAVDLIIKILPALNFKYLYISVLVLILLIVYFMAGWIGIGISLITTCIGLIPVFYNSRRSNCMASLLVPIALNMGGKGDAVIRFLGLA